MAISTGKSTPPDPRDLFLGADDVADVFRFTPATLEAADTVTGGGGAVIDILQFTAAGTIKAGSFDGVSGIERIQSHAGGNSYALTQALVAGAFGTFEARGLAGDDRIDASAVQNPALGISFISGGGADTLIGGAGADRFNALAASAGARALTGGGGNDVVTTSAALWSAADIFAGGSGIDRITFAEAGHVTSAQLAGISSVEEIQFFSNITLSVTVTAALVAQAGGLLTVIGGAGSGQAVDASAVMNGRVHYLAGTGADTFLGTAGDDVFAVQEAGSTGELGDGDDILNLDNRKASGIVVDGGAGYDTAVLAAGGVWDLTGLSNFEQLELAGTGTVLLPAQPGLRVLGSTQRDVVTLGGPGQTFFGFAGDDTVVLTPATMVGAVLHGGSQSGEDTLRLAAAGSYDLRRTAITGFEKIDQAAVPGGSSVILLPNTPFDVVLRHTTTLFLGAHAQQTVAGSPRPDTFHLGAAGQFIDGGGGTDIFVGTAAHLAAGTVLAGGTGIDELQIQGAGTLNLATDVLLLGVERLRLLSPFDLTLDLPPGPEIIGSDGADTVTAASASHRAEFGIGNDLLRMPLSLLGGVGDTIDGGAGTDTLFVVDDQAGFFSVALSNRFVGFERLDLTGTTTVHLTIADNVNRQVVLGSGNTTVFGGEGAEEFVNAGFVNVISGGAGADTIRQTVAPNSSQVLVGNDGDDVIVYDRTGATATTTMPNTWAAETVRLLGTLTFTTNLQNGLVVIGDPLIGNNITIRGDNQQAIGGSGADTLSSNGGLTTTLQGGAGQDVYVVSAAHQTQWNTAGQVIQDVATSFVLNRMQVTGSGALAIDFNRHTIEHIDRIEFASAATAADFTLTDAMAMTADGNNDGGTGDLFAEALVAMTAGVRLDATGFGATRSLRTLGSFDGADTVLGGAGPDTLAGAAGNDLMNGGAGADSLSGGNGADSLVGGAGADNFNGGAGGDRITLTEAATATDRVHYTSPNDGTFDINDDSSVNQNTADSIIGFATASDRITLDRAGLGLGSGGIVNVAANGAWNIGTGAVFLFESDSVNSDTLSNNNHASLDAIGFAINFDNAAGSGSSAGRKVALVISNPETQATRTTGIYLWTDTDGDSLVDVGDVVRLLAVLNSVTANQMVSGSSIELI